MAFHRPEYCTPATGERGRASFRCAGIGYLKGMSALSPTSDRPVK
jgi:hypothetical protein